MKQLPDRFIFMKVGNHAGETWEGILERKRKELRDSGMIFWGYGGRACHPIQQVQPFARLSLKESNHLALVMEPMDSKADPDVVPATEFSIDGIKWNPLPNGISVTGSRYAIVLSEITEADLEIPLHQYEVGIGPSRGRPAENYLQARTDKGCLQRSVIPRKGSKETIHRGGIYASLKDPFAVILK